MVISADLNAQILRLYETERWRVGTIARQLHVHRDTVRRVLAQAGLPPPTAVLRPSRIDPFRAFILQTLAKFPTLTAARLFDMVTSGATAAAPTTSATSWLACARDPQPRPTCGCARCRANKRKSTGGTSATWQ